MELFNKLKKILFDEVTEEIPVITKEDKKSEDKPKEQAKKSEEEPKKRAADKSDDVIIRKIETPKREKRYELPEDDEQYDMPKLKEEAKEEIKKSTFTFPVFGDDENEDVPPKRRERKEDRKPEKEKSRTSMRERDVKVEPDRPRRTDSVGYTNAFDYSYGKYKGDYKASREQSHEILTKTLEEKEEHKTFTPSPIISPVYGVLNENYKKEDIVSKRENKKPVEVLDLDSVRRKAYGTLEDEIEESLSRAEELEKQVEPEVVESIDDDDEGISINDLLVDSSDYRESDEDLGSIELDEETELFDKSEDESEEVLDEIIPVVEEDDDEDEFDQQRDDLEGEILGALDEQDERRVPSVTALQKDEDEKPVEKKSSKKEKTVDKEDAIGEEDLFDLIESIYDRKGEE